jgi:hypothetical protein
MLTLHLREMHMASRVSAAYGAVLLGQCLVMIGTKTLTAVHLSLSRHVLTGQVYWNHCHLTNVASPSREDVDQAKHAYAENQYCPRMVCIVP